MITSTLIHCVTKYLVYPFVIYFCCFVRIIMVILCYVLFVSLSQSVLCLYFLVFFLPYNWPNCANEAYVDEQMRDCLTFYRKKLVVSAQLIFLYLKTFKQKNHKIHIIITNFFYSKRRMTNHDTTAIFSFGQQRVLYIFEYTINVLHHLKKTIKVQISFFFAL